MGILNITPDSFYDGGRHVAIDVAVERAMQMLAEGADSIDIGGESTGPGSKTIEEAEELRRVIPVIETLKHKTQNAAVVISIDTYKTNVAEAALKAGATIVNDVTAGRGDPMMFSLIARTGCSYIMMRSKDHSPRTTVNALEYDDILGTIHTFFEERIASAESAGIKRSQIIVDPGLGHFVSSDPKYSWYILEHLECLNDFGCRVLVSPSRKSFTAEFPGQPPEERLPGTLKATSIALRSGASIIRTHDVKETSNLIAEIPKQ